jgi:hypothetical protein
VLLERVFEFNHKIMIKVQESLHLILWLLETYGL